MKYWNIRTPKQLFASCIWNISEYFEVGLGKYAPTVFGWMIGAKVEQKQTIVYNTCIIKTKK